MGFQIGKFKQDKFSIEMDQILAELLIRLLEIRLCIPVTKVDDKIQRSIDAEIYNMIGAKLNAVKPEADVKLKLMYHQAIQLWRICIESTKQVEFSYKINLEQLAGQIHQKI